MTLLNIWAGGLLLLPLIGLSVTGYCLYRWLKTGFIIPAVVGCIIGAMSVIGLVALIFDK